LVGNLKGKKPYGRPKRRWEDIRMDIREVRWELWTGFKWLRTESSGVLL
jgi:hypothetical protein